MTPTTGSLTRDMHLSELGIPHKSRVLEQNSKQRASKRNGWDIPGHACRRLTKMSQWDLVGSKIRETCGTHNKSNNTLLWLTYLLTHQTQTACDLVYARLDGAYLTTRDQLWRVRAFALRPNAWDCLSICDEIPHVSTQFVVGDLSSDISVTVVDATDQAALSESAGENFANNYAWRLIIRSVVL